VATCPHCDNAFREDVDGAIHNDVACKTALRARALAAEAKLATVCANVSGALCDAHHPDVVVYERDYARSVRELTAQRNALQTEVERMRKALDVPCHQRDACDFACKCCQHRWHLATTSMT